MKKININLQDICNYEINLLHNNDIYTRMTKELINFDLKNWKNSLWYKYYSNYCPKNLNDIYKINSTILNNLPPETIFEPWTHDYPIPTYRFKRLGMYGPKNKDYIYQQIKKTKNLIISIQKNGFIESTDIKNNIVVEILKFNDKIKYLVTSGNHRINVLKAFDLKTVNVCIKQNHHLKSKNLINNKIYDVNKPYRSIINYNSADTWPAVKSNYMSLEKAQQMFLSYFA
jgi:hypothetical protein